jgi:hypothetical protein
MVVIEVVETENPVLQHGSFDVWLDASVNQERPVSLVDMRRFMNRLLEDAAELNEPIPEEAREIIFNLTRFQRLSEAFIREFLSLLDIPLLLTYQDLDELFALELQVEYMMSD